jgi:hypothetical protein
MNTGKTFPTGVMLSGRQEPTCYAFFAQTKGMNMYLLMERSSLRVHPHFISETIQEDMLTNLVLEAIPDL